MTRLRLLPPLVALALATPVLFAAWLLVTLCLVLPLYVWHAWRRRRYWTPGMTLAWALLVWVYWLLMPWLDSFDTYGG